MGHQRMSASQQIHAGWAEVRLKASRVPAGSQTTLHASRSRTCSTTRVLGGGVPDVLLEACSRCPLPDRRDKVRADISQSGEPYQKELDRAKEKLKLF